MHFRFPFDFFFLMVYFKVQKIGFFFWCFVVMFDIG